MTTETTYWIPDLCIDRLEFETTTLRANVKQVESGGKVLSWFRFKSLPCSPEHFNNPVNRERFVFACLDFCHKNPDKATDSRKLANSILI